MSPSRARRRAWRQSNVEKIAVLIFELRTMGFSADKLDFATRKTTHANRPHVVKRLREMKKWNKVYP